VSEQFCPLTDDWLKPMSYSSFYLERLPDGKYLETLPKDRVIFMDVPTPLSITSRFQFHGQFWEFVEDVNLEWSLAGDDHRLSMPSFEPERYCHDTPVHLHSDYLFLDHKYHIDYLHWDQTSPLNGFYEYRVFLGSDLIARGGNWGMSIGGGGTRNWPLACAINNKVILFTRFQIEDNPVDLPPIRIYQHLDNWKVVGTKYDYTDGHWDKAKFEMVLFEIFPTDIVNDRRINVLPLIVNLADYFDGCLLESKSFTDVLGLWVSKNRSWFKGGDRSTWEGDSKEKWVTHIVSTFSHYVLTALTRSTC